MLESFESDTEHRVTLRERLKTQDEALARIADLMKSVDQRLASIVTRGPGGAAS